MGMGGVEWNEEESPDEKSPTAHADPVLASLTLASRRVEQD